MLVHCNTEMIESNTTTATYWTEIKWYDLLCICEVRSVIEFSISIREQCQSQSNTQQITHENWISFDPTEFSSLKYSFTFEFSYLILVNWILLCICSSIALNIVFTKLIACSRTRNFETNYIWHVELCSIKYDTHTQRLNNW